MIRLIEYFRPDGKNESPSGVYFEKGSLCREIEKNKNCFIHQIDEAVFTNQYGLNKYKGGMIVFAVTVNVQKFGVSLKTFVYQLFYSCMNRIFRDKKLNSLIHSWNEKYKDSEDFLINSFTVGNFFKGRYIDEGKIYNDKSTCIEFCGVPSELLILFAAELCKHFKQQTVLVKDYNLDKIYLADAEGFDDEDYNLLIKKAGNEINKVKRLNRIQESIEKTIQWLCNI